MAATCADCARFKVPNAGCTYTKDIREGIIKADDPACSDFKSKPKEKRQKRIEKASGFSDEGFFEAIYHKGEPCFLVLGKDNEFNIFEKITVNEKLFFPKEKPHFPYEPYHYYPDQVPNREDLFWKSRNEIHSFIDVEPIWKDVLAACVLLSYQQEKLLTVPYIYLYGDNESGKSTVLQILNFLCYRPLFGVTVPSADIFGYLEDSDAIGTVLEDELQGVDKDVDKLKIYKSGYKKGACVPRTLITQNDRIIKYYNTFSFKACASEQIPSVKGFRERFIEISMVEGYPEKEFTDIIEEDLKRFRDLRNMLLKWRMLSREWQLPNPELNMKGRMKELWKPILQITHGLTVYPTLANFIEDQKNERLSSKQNTLEGHIVKVVTELCNQGKANPIPFVDIWDSLVIDLDGKIDEKKPHVMDTSEFFNVTKNKVGFRLREILSGKSKTVREKDVTIKAYEFNQEKLRRIAAKYGYEFVTKLSMLPSSESAQAPNSTLKEYEENVEKCLHAPLEVSNISNSVTSIQEVKILLRSSFKKGTDQDFISEAMRLGNLTEKEAHDLFDKLVDEGSLSWFDENGVTLWSWTK